MALELNINYQRSTDKLSLIVTDNTGSGATGYGGSNPATGDFTNFNITVTMPDAITFEPTGTSVTVNAYSALPSAVNGTYTITNTQLGLGATEELPDGVYKFVVAADYSGGTEGTAEATDYLVAYETTACCIESLIIDAFGCGCSGNSDKIQRLTAANLWLNSLYPKVNSLGEVVGSPVVQCEQWNTAADMIRELNRICEQSNCGGCGGCN
jgi:hypothetical protein